MEFKSKFKIFLKHLPRMKFSIRLSILSIVLILLVGISVVIIGINFFSINSLLMTSAKNTMSQSSGKVSEQIKNHLQPLNKNIFTAQRMLKEGIVDPQQEGFAKFLYGLIVDDEDLVGAYWADVKGNFYWLNRDKDQGFSEHRILVKAGRQKVTKSYLNLSGKVIASENLTSLDFDPRQRPWYQQAKAKKGVSWVVYRFVEIDSQEPQFGVTSAFPFYDSLGNLIGVMGIDMPLGRIDNYIKNIKVTENSAVFVTDLNGNLIAAHNEQGVLLGYQKISEINGADVSWLKKSFELYKQKFQTPFVFLSEGEEYVASYEKIGGVKSDEPWFVAIVTPIDDITSPLFKSVLVGMVLTVLVLFVGIFLASVFSTSLSRPIRKLASDANLICQLRLDMIIHRFSRIKEIADMADSFIRMKNTLYSFQRYMPVALIKKLIASNKVAAVGGEAKELTLFFTDIENFTHLTEGFEPEELMQYLSEYFQTITKIIIEMSGTVDKYIGDGVMAFWGAPIDDESHSLHACQAAVKIHQALEKLNKKWQLEGKPVVYTRTGISSGHVVVGNVGSDDKLNYTSLGDAVNIASRLEGLNKIYGSNIMVSEFVYAKVKDKFKFRLLDRVAVKGKTYGIYIYELLGELDNKEPDLVLEEYNYAFYVAFSSYAKGEWEMAFTLFNELSKKYPSDKLLNLFVARCSSYLTNPPTNWDGIWVMDEK